MKPVIVRLKGGLGNQMFQYAFGRARSLDLGVPLVLDTSELKNDLLRSYSLHSFGIDCPVDDTAGRSISETLSIALSRTFKKNINFGNFYNERFFKYDSLIETIAKPKLYNGYWQSERYFARHMETIRRDFRILESHLGQAPDYCQKLTQVDSISLHIRRGDYVSNPEVTAFHGLCGPDYYQNAIAQALPGIKQPMLFIFTDDPDWVRTNLTWPIASEIVSGRGFSDIQEMFLMSQCSQNIIANSSFSWWAAWLNNHPHKRVFAPQAWFANKTIDTSDVIPIAWIRL